MDFRHLPRESETASWSWAGLWLLSIYATIPLARGVQEIIRAQAGKLVFLWITLVAFVLAAGWVVHAVRRRELALSPRRSAILFAILTWYAWLLWTMRGNAEETFHFVQYGLLSVLLFRALSHRVADVSIYFAVTAIGTVCGILDELIQWLVPRRYFEFRDIAINLLAVALVQLALGAGIRPLFIQGHNSAAGMRIGLWASVVCLALLALSLNISSPSFT
jgi:hypothetical protein